MIIIIVIIIIIIIVIIIIIIIIIIILLFLLLLLLLLLLLSLSCHQVKTLKQQLESKDLHLDLMRKKVATLEEGVAGRSIIQREKDDQEWNYRKLSKENDRLRGELANARRLVMELKAEMTDLSNLKVSPETWVYILLIKGEVHCLTIMISLLKNYLSCMVLNGISVFGKETVKYEALEKLYFKSMH